MVENETAGVLTFNGKNYAVGLTWLMASENDNTAVAKRRAQKAQGDFYCLRTRVARQHGIGFSGKGHRAGMPVAAEIAATLIVGEWHGVFRADNGWWYVQVHADAIAPNGDQFFTSEEAAYNAFVEAAQGHNWAEGYAPADWDTKARTKSIGLENILDDPAQIRLQPVSLSLPTDAKGIAITLLVILLLCGLAYGGFSLYQSINAPLVAPPPPPPPPALAQKQKQITEEEATIGSKPKTAPRPSEVMDSCGEAFARIIYPIPGWPMLQAACDGETARVAWEKDTGTVLSLRRAMANFPEDANFRIEGNSFTVSLGVVSRGEYPLEDKLSTIDALTQIEQAFDRVGKLNVKTPDRRLRPVQRQVQPRGQSQGIDPLAILEPEIELTLETLQSPKSLAYSFDINGLAINSIQWKVRERLWVYEASVKVAE